MIDDLIARSPDILTILVIFVAVPLNWYVTWLLWQLHRADPGSGAIQVMGILSTCIALTVTVFAAVFVNNGLDDPLLTSRETMLITRGSLLLLFTVSPLVFLGWWYRRKNGHGS